MSEVRLQLAAGGWLAVAGGGKWAAACPKGKHVKDGAQTGRAEPSEGRQKRNLRCLES